MNASETQVVRAGTVTQLVTTEGMILGAYTQIWYIRLPAPRLSEEECLSKVTRGFRLFNRGVAELCQYGDIDGTLQQWDLLTVKLLSDEEARTEPWEKEPGDDERLEDRSRYRGGITVMKGRFGQDGAIEIGWE